MAERVTATLSNASKTREGVIASFRRRISGSAAVEKALENEVDEGFISEDWSEKVEWRQPRKSAIFIDAEAMKEKVRANLAVPKRDTCYHFKETGICTQIAKHIVFERTMLTVIALNAIWIAVDTDYNQSEVLVAAHPVFQVIENLFCFAFSVEWIIRFSSFQKKKYAFRNAWFVFDSCLVFVMVLETWVMTAYLLLSSSTGGGSSLGNSSILKIARLLRLSRMARMARLLRAMPELMIMVKGMITAVRSVAITLTLLILIMYAFGVAFCQMTKEADIGRRHFATVLDSMYTLGLFGTLLDNIKYMSDELGKENHLLAVLFYLYVLLTAFTVMNMLIGVLCEVVSAVAATEREEILVTYVKGKVLKVVEQIDQDGNGYITKAEMIGILESASACRALKEVGVDVMSLVDNADAIFVDVKGKELDQLSFGDFMNVVLSLRGCNNATVKDIVELRKVLRTMNEEVMMKFQPLMRQLQRLSNQLKPPHHDINSVASCESDKASRLSSPVLRSGSRPDLLQLDSPAAECLDLEGPWCPLGQKKAPEVPQQKAPEVPEWVPAKSPGGGGSLQMRRRSLPQQQSGAVKLPRFVFSPSPPVVPPEVLVLGQPEENGGWCELPEAVPEQPFRDIHPFGRPDTIMETSHPLAANHGEARPKPPPLEDAAWREIPPPADVPTPELVNRCPSLPPGRRPAWLPTPSVPDAPDRPSAFDVPSPCKCLGKAPKAPASQPCPHIVCRGAAEPAFEDSSEAACTPASAEGGRLGPRLPPLTSESGGFCPVGAVELRGHMAELTKSLTAGLCQVKRMEERLRQPVRTPPHWTGPPTCLPTALMGSAKATPVELE